MLFSSQPLLFLLFFCAARFELLQQTTQLHQQPLICPLNVETSAALELVIADHLDVFARNGFKLKVDLEGTPGTRVKLLSVPFSKSVRFGVDDVNELASMISERNGGSDNDHGDATSQRTNKNYLMLKNSAINSQSSGSSSSTSSNATESDPSSTSGSAQNDAFRLPKVVAMYASRACRSAVMIGTALHTRDMSRIVERLEHVEQPWNCPHGRPTLRHLVDLTPLREHSTHKHELLHNQGAIGSPALNCQHRPLLFQNLNFGGKSSEQKVFATTTDSYYLHK